MNAERNRRFLRSTIWIMTAICILFIANPMVASAEQVPKIQDLCKVLRDADRYHDKIVTIRGVLRTHWEWGGLYGEHCKQVTIDGTKMAASVATYPVGSDRAGSLPEGAYALLDRESIKTVDQEVLAAIKSGSDIECKVVVVGVLHSRDEKRFYKDKNGRLQRMGFGHLGAHAAEPSVLRIEIVSELKKIPRLM